MRPDPLPGPLHPGSTLKFDGSLRWHLIKHVVEDWLSEDWSGILGQEEIRRARHEHQTNQLGGPALTELADRYETLAADQLSRACESEDHHAHFWGKFPPRGEPVRKSSLDNYLSIVGWTDDSRLLWVAAGAHVRKGNSLEYDLLSAYRLLREASPFERSCKILEHRYMQVERGLGPLDCPGPDVASMGDDE